MSADRLELSEWIDSVPDAVGEQVSIHHCKSGRGNNKLYIKRIENGAIAFCHHCSQRGYASNRILEGGSHSRAIAYSGGVSHPARVVGTGRTGEAGHTEGGERGNVTKNIVTLPIDSCSKVARWGNTDAKIWILKYGIPVSTIESAGIVWSDYFSSIIFPRYLAGELVSYQMRRFPNEGGPKYITRGDSNSHYDALRGPTRGSLCVLVEDYVSALKVSQIASAFPLGGTAMKDTQLRHLLQDYDKFVVMLDNDNWQVKMNQMKLAKRIGVYTQQVYVEPMVKDPKEHSLDELKLILGIYE